MWLLNCHPLQALCTLDLFMSHLHLQIEGLWCNNCSFYTSRALTPEANAALRGAEAALHKPGFLSQGLNQTPLSVRQVPLVGYEMFVHSSEKQSLQCWWVRSLLDQEAFPLLQLWHAQCKPGSCMAEVGKKQDHLSWWQTTVLTQSSGSCYTSC